MNQNKRYAQIIKNINFDEKHGKIIRQKVKDIIHYLLTYNFKEEDFEFMDVRENKYPINFSIILNTDCYLIITHQGEYNIKICKDKFGKEGMDAIFCSFSEPECNHMKQAAYICITEFIEVKYKKMLDNLTLRA